MRRTKTLVEPGQGRAVRQGFIRTPRGEIKAQAPLLMSRAIRVRAVGSERSAKSQMQVDLGQWAVVLAMPARSAAAIRELSVISSREAPAAFAPLTWASMQYGHCVVNATPSAMSSRYFF